MLVHLKSDVQTFIEERVREGDFEDADEAVSAAVRQMAERHEQLAKLDAALQIGIDQLERGEGIEWSPELMDEIFAEAMKRFEAGERVEHDGAH